MFHFFMDSGLSPSVEKEHVHDVYDVIATHFSATRYKPWPVVDDYISSRPLYSIGADVGCGNGKYLGVNKSVFLLGSDHSSKLCEICLQRGHEGFLYI